MNDWPIRYEVGIFKLKRNNRLYRIFRDDDVLHVDPWSVDRNRTRGNEYGWTYDRDNPINVDDWERWEPWKDRK